jgi:hypothetical protein
LRYHLLAMPKGRLPRDDAGATAGDAATADQKPSGQQTLIRTPLGPLPGAALPTRS